MASAPLVQLRLAGYGLLGIGLINLLLRAGLSVGTLSSAPGRLALANGLAGFAPWLLLSLALIFVQGNRQRHPREGLAVTLLHRLLLPLLVGYLLLIPLMVRDAVGFHRGLQGQIDSQLTLYRSGSARLQEQVRSIGTPRELVRVLQQYPSISVAADGTESAGELRRRLADALRIGESQLRGRLEDLRRGRGEGLAQRILQSALVCLVAAAGLAALRFQNLELIQRSGHAISEYFSQDQLPMVGRSAGRRRRRRSAAAYPHALLGIEVEESETPESAQG